VIVGASVSRYTLSLLEPAFPLRSSQVAVSVTAPSSCGDVEDDVVQLFGSGGALFDDACQFQVTVTGELFQPAEFGTGDSVGVAFGTHSCTYVVLP
jgi:hypothetical protein